MGASNTVRTERSASRAVLIAAIRRIADSESPPRSKNESSTPTRSTPEHLGVDAGQDLLDRAGRGAVTSPSLVFGCRQGAGVEFAVDRQRQRLDHHHRGRHHVGRQPLGQLRRALRGSRSGGVSVT